MKRRDLSSVFMTNGCADTPWHSVLESCQFRVPAFDQRQHDLCGYCHLYVIKMTWISNLGVYFQQWCWRLAYAFCYVGRLVFRRSRKTLVTNTLSCFRIMAVNGHPRCPTVILLVIAGKATGKIIQHPEGLSRHLWTQVRNLNDATSAVCS